MVNRSDRDPPSLNRSLSYELLGEMRRRSAKSIRARRLRSAKQAGYKPATLPVGHHTKETLHIGRRPYKRVMVNRSDRDPPSLNRSLSYELLGEMRRRSAKSIRARRLRSAKQAGYKPATLP